MRLRGPVPVEVVAGGLAGSLHPTRLWLPRCDARTAAHRWVFERASWRPAVWTARAEGAPGAGPLLKAHRKGFRRREIVLPSGEVLDWRQLGFFGSRYSIARPGAGGLEVMTLRNTGGALRWNGEIRIRGSLRDLDGIAPLLVLFAVFLVFQSAELGFG